MLTGVSQLLIDSGAPVLLIRESRQSETAIGAFTYGDLNSYLLTVVGAVLPDEEHIKDFQELARKAREGTKIPIKDVKNLGRKEPLITLPDTADLLKAVETFGTGIHRIVIVKEGTETAVGILSQTRLMKFMWEQRKSFPVIDQLYPQYLRDLKVGSNLVVSIK